jgi:hypothetical protein
MVASIRKTECTVICRSRQEKRWQIAVHHKALILIPLHEMTGSRLKVQGFLELSQSESRSLRLEYCNTASKSASRQFMYGKSRGKGAARSDSPRKRARAARGRDDSRISRAQSCRWNRCCGHARRRIDGSTEAVFVELATEIAVTVAEAGAETVFGTTYVAADDVLLVIAPGPVDAPLHPRVAPIVRDRSGHAESLILIQSLCATWRDAHRDCGIGRRCRL